MDKNRAMKCGWMVAIAAAGLAFAALGSGCERTPPDVAALREGTKLELKGDYAGAEEKYLEACGAGNGEAYKKLADLIANREASRIFLESKRDVGWEARARAVVERLETVAAQAEAHGCAIEGIGTTLASYRKTLEETGKRLAEERAAAEKREAEARAAAEAEARAREEARKREEAEAAAKRAAEAEAAAKRAAEAKKRESADYCIENGLELTSAAFREICRAMNYSQNTGNSLVDDEENSRQHALFRGKRVKLTGKITKVDSKLFGGVKIKLNVYGESVWANFPSMSQSEGKSFWVGQSLTVEGKVEMAMINQFNLGNCNIVGR
ncbi:MAG: hypothetical protein ILO10_02240 [Kiritimatiellae bacterium]|nr:hypothetical protein [Kiritimatiellia bacterium]